MPYRHTLRLPSTVFAMRAGLREAEPESQRRWRRSGLPAALAERGDAPPTVLHDGPPYANGPIHLGHVVNKVLKDVICRAAWLDGRGGRWIAGWDCHGLPIEHGVARKADRATRADPLALRAACARSAERWIARQREGFERLSLIAELDEPYRTLDPAYEAACLELLAELAEDGLIYREARPVHWSPSSRSALAEAELEYRELEQPSAWVALALAEPLRLAFGMGAPLDPAALVVWTTTPWSLTANAAVAVHPELEYTLLSAEGPAGPRLLVVGEQARPRLEQAIGATTPLASAPGEALIGLRYRRPLGSGGGAVVAAPWVRADEGSGLVHVAPGHGPADFELGRALGLEARSVLGPNGRFDDDSPDAQALGLEGLGLDGLDSAAASAQVLERLGRSRALLASAPLRHRVAHDWRSGRPVVYRLSAQWFCALDRPIGRRGGATLRELALAAIDDPALRFDPPAARQRLRAMTRERPDWCLSRQRAWGLPLPAFEREDGEIVLEPALIRAVAAQVRQHGADIWWRRTPAELLADSGVDAAGWRRGGDILDVWFEAGCSWFAALAARGQGEQADCVCEGSDQHRGWFGASLLTSLATRGRAPFRRIVTHGFVVDEAGRKQSKSEGNVSDPERLLDRYGADVVRWWIASLDPTRDVRLDAGGAAIEPAAESYRKLRTSLRFALGNLADAPLDARADAPAPTSLERWLLGELRAHAERVVAAYEALALPQARLELAALASALSGTYGEAVKDRLYCDAADSPRRRAAQAALATGAELLCLLAAPLLPHTADEAWRALRRVPPEDDTPSVHLQRWRPLIEALPAPLADSPLPALRRAAHLLLEAEGVDNPLEAGLRLPLAWSDHDPDDLADLCGVSLVVLDGDGPRETPPVRIDLGASQRCERCWKRPPSLTPRPQGALCARCAAVVPAS